MTEDVAATSATSYAVRQIRGPFLELSEHPGHAASEKELATLCAELRVHGVPLAADLFSGAGGMSLGLEEAGFRVVLGVDHYGFAVETHRHHFAGMSVEEDMADPATIRRVAKLLERNKVDLLAGDRQQHHRGGGGWSWGSSNLLAGLGTRGVGVVVAAPDVRPHVFQLLVGHQRHGGVCVNQRGGYAPFPVGRVGGVGEAASAGPEPSSTDEPASVADVATPLRGRPEGRALNPAR